MKNQYQQFKPTTVQRAVQALIFTLGTGFASYAVAALTFSDSPPVNKSSPQPTPNVILSVDDSGSMGTQGIQELKNALKDAFSVTNMPDGKIRLAYQAMWNHRGFGPNRQNAAQTCTGSGKKKVCVGPFNNSLRTFEGAHRADFNSWIDTLVASGWTPSHAMMLNAGEYLKGKWLASTGGSTGTDYINLPSYENPWNTVPGEADDAPLGCRRAYHIFMTDGEWNSFNGQLPNISTKNSDASAPVNFDGTAHTFPDGRGYSVSSGQTRIYRDSYGKTTGSGKNIKHNSTFSDLAFYYWATDLQPGIQNRVDKAITMPVVDSEVVSSGNKSVTFDPYWNPKNNVATWQHMQTYTIGFNDAANIPGFDGNYGSLYARYATGRDSWPDVITYQSGRNLELWHGALNSRAKFYPATSEETLTNAFKDILREIVSVAAEPGIASGAGSGNWLNSGTMAYIASYVLNEETNEWEGSLRAQRGDGINEAPLWYASVPSANNRKIITTDAAGKGIPFRWSDLSSGLTAAQKAALNLGTSGQVVNQIRSLPLRDIVHSQIAFSGAPNAGLITEDYKAFVSAYKDRNRVVFVGGNDGMLHGFDSGNGRPASQTNGDPGTGAEVLAYVPRGLVTSLKALTDTPYLHRYWVDGSPFVGDAQIGSDEDGGWGTVLVGTLGAGGKGYYILDVTDPSSFSEAQAAKLVIMDTTDSTDPDIGHQFHAPVLEAYSNTRSAQIVRLNKDAGDHKEWAVIMGNGYNSTNGHPVLLIQSLGDANGNRPLYKVDACTVAGSVTCGASPYSSGDTNGLSAPRPVDVNGDGTVDLVYAGDLKGNVWKFDLTSASTADWKVALGGQPMFVATGPTGVRQPITAAPLAVVHPHGGYMIGVGTGKNLTEADTLDENLNSFYGLYDNQAMSLDESTKIITLGAGSPIPEAGTPANGNRYAKLYRQSAGALGQVDEDGLRKGTSTTLSNVKIDGVTMRGWYYDLPDLQNDNASKVLLNPSAASANTVRFLSQNVASSSLPETNGTETCDAVTVQGAKTQINYFDIFTGNRPKADLAIMVNGVLKVFKAPDANRFQTDTTNYIASGPDSLKAIGTDDSFDVLAPDVPGLRAGWRIAK